MYFSSVILWIKKKFIHFKSLVFNVNTKLPLTFFLEPQSKKKSKYNKIIFYVSDEFFFIKKFYN